MAGNRRDHRADGVPVGLFLASEAPRPRLRTLQSARHPHHRVRRLDTERHPHRPQRPGQPGRPRGRDGRCVRADHLQARRRHARLPQAQVAADRGQRADISRVLHWLDAVQSIRPGHRPYRAADGLRVPQRVDPVHLRAARRSVAQRRDRQLLLLRPLADGRAERDLRRRLKRVVQPVARAHTRVGRRRDVLSCSHASALRRRGDASRHGRWSRVWIRSRHRIESRGRPGVHAGQRHRLSGVLRLDCRRGTRRTCRVPNPELVPGGVLVVVQGHQDHQHLRGRPGDRLHDPGVPVLQLHARRPAPARVRHSVRHPVHRTRAELLHVRNAGLQADAAQVLHNGDRDGNIVGWLGVYQYVGPAHLRHASGGRRGDQSVSVPGLDRVRIRQEGGSRNCASSARGGPAGRRSLPAVLSRILQLSAGHRRGGHSDPVRPHAGRVGRTDGAGRAIHHRELLADRRRPRLAENDRDLGIACGDSVRRLASRAAPGRGPRVESDRPADTYHSLRAADRDERMVCHL